jgi:hypothetical protein
LTRAVTISKNIQRRYERLFVGKIYKALQSQIKTFTANLKAGGVEYAKGIMSTDVMNLQIGPVIQQLYRLAGVTNANNVYRDIKRFEPKEKLAGFGFNEKWTQEINRYFQLHLLEKAVLPISETTKNQILALLQKATEEGWSVERTVKELETSDITKNRARKIVRTETVRAVNFGGMLGAYESKLVMDKEWISAHDNRVRGKKPEDRHSHVSLDGDKTDMLKPFHDSRSGEPIQFPGDPEASAGNTINCRCVLGFVPKRDKNGRVIRKPEPASGIKTSLVDLLGGLVLGIELVSEFINDN